MELREAANELAYEKYMESRPETPCGKCMHVHVCWKVGTVNAVGCKDFESDSMKLKELLPLLRNEPFELAIGDWKNHREVMGYADFEEFSETELEMEIASIDVCEVYLKEDN